MAQAHVPTSSMTHSRLPPRRPITARAEPSIYFATKFADGRVAETANSGHVNPFPPIAGQELRQFPGVGDPKSLYQIHRLLTVPMGSTPRAFPAPGEEAEFLSNSLANFYRTHVGTGYLQEVDPDWIYRPTFKGAYLMTWRILPPMSWIACWRRHLSNRAFLAEHRVLAESMFRETR